VNNIALFVCGLAVTLLSGMGVLVYMVSVGYRKKKPIEVDADLGAVEKSFESWLLARRRPTSVRS
jgi:hypothetical protein